MITDQQGAEIRLRNKNRVLDLDYAEGYVVNLASDIDTLLTALDEARRENERLQGAARWALGLNNELQKECASLRRQNERIKALSRCIVVEQVLLDIANGKRDLPTREECRKLALKLGVPGEDLDKCEGEW